MTTLLKSWKGRNYQFEFTDPSKPVRTFRSRRPCHFIFEIQSYSQLLVSLSKFKLTSFETPEFSAGGDKWTMCFYPTGNVPRGGQGFVSMYLRRKKNPGNRSKEASVAIKFFILDQKSDEYFVIEDMGEKQFDTRGKEWGIPQILEINYFNESNNGFVVDNTCTIGAEIFITSSEPSYSKMSLVKTISKRLFELAIRLDPSNSADKIDSISFVTKFDDETYTWKLNLYQDGYAEGTDSHISIYLELDDVKSKLSNGRKMLVDFQISLKNKRTSLYGNDMNALEWFHDDKNTSGFPTFIKREDFNSDPLTKYDYGQTANIKVNFNLVYILNDAEG